jgi:hypothetical protein
LDWFKVSVGFFLVCSVGSGSEPDFVRDIRPILTEKCYACHGPDENKRKSDLRFDVMEEAIEYGAITPGDITDSLLVDQILEDDPDDVMPPPKTKNPLTENEKKLLIDWVASGANYESHWAFESIENPPVPQMEGVSNPIDAFIRQKLGGIGLVTSPEADKEILIRRVAIDLTGLPPDLEMIDAFLEDGNADAYERLVDSLLASPQYGEHMASQWLDVARYADTFGYQSDVEMDVWPWRDWVIDAFNQNLPFDDFLTWQLAGDLLPNATQEQKIATAFNRLHRQTNEGGSINEEFLVEYAADRAQTVATAFLGLTMECARCHDHKFDPISQKDFYQFTSFFNNIDESGLYSHFTRTAPTPALFLHTDKTQQKHDELLSAIEDAEQELDEETESAEKRFKKWIRKKRNTVSVREPIIHLDFDSELTDNKLANLADEEKTAHTEGGYTAVEGASGLAAQFTGENAVVIKDAAIFDREDAFTISFWMYLENPLEYAIVCHRAQAESDAANRGYEVMIHDNRPVFGLNHFWPGNAIRVQSEAPIPHKEWVHLSFTYDGSSRAAGTKIFINGKETAKKVIRDHLYRTIEYKKDGSDPPLKIGARFRDRGVKVGRIDDFKVFPHDLTNAEIASAYSRDEAVVDSISSNDAFQYFVNVVDEKTVEKRVALASAREKESRFVETVPQLMTMEEQEEPRVAYLLDRGAYDKRKDPVGTSTPEQLPEFTPNLPANRLGLARWLLSEQNPLTARVAVNRLWQQVFGVGLVETQEDFGLQGMAPSHPELLDHLAASFRESEWDVKAMLKRMVMSSTYRQSSQPSGNASEIDPLNQWLSHSPTYRRSAEEIRDGALASSGLLVKTIGGRSVKPYQQEGIWRDASGATYKADKGDGLYRRSMYTFLKRTVPPPTMITFDSTARDVCVVRRERTMTPLQSLILLNNTQYVEASRVLAEQACSQYDETEDLITYIFRSLVTRRPTDKEFDVLSLALAEQRAWFKENETEAKSYIAVGERTTRSDAAPERLAAVTAIAQLIMNHEEFQVKR